jgi:hypothetical protein
MPLMISIISNQQTICVSNPLQKRTNTEVSSKTGLKNIQARYSFMTDEKVIIEETNNTFSVTIPLLQNV